MSANEQALNVSQAIAGPDMNSTPVPLWRELYGRSMRRRSPFGCFPAINISRLTLFCALSNLHIFDLSRNYILYWHCR